MSLKLGEVNSSGIYSSCGRSKYCHTQDITTQKVIAKFYLNIKPQKLQVYKQKGAVDKSLHT